MKIRLTFSLHNTDNSSFLSYQTSIFCKLSNILKITRKLFKKETTDLLEKYHLFVDLNLIICDLDLIVGIRDF